MRWRCRPPIARHDPRRRTRRDLHAGKPFVRPLLAACAACAASTTRARTCCRTAHRCGSSRRHRCSRSTIIRAASIRRRRTCCFYLDPKQTTEFQPGTNHGWSSGHLSWNNGQWDQWVNQKQDVLTMGYLKRQDLTYHYALADAFTICDSYFCSAHADTATASTRTGTVDPRNIWQPAERPGHRRARRRERLHVDDLRGTPREREDQLEGYRRHGHPGRPDRQLHRQLADVLQALPGEGASGPLVDKGASDHTLAELKADVQANRLPQVSCRRRTQVQRAPAGADRRRVLHQHGARGARRTRKCGRRRCSS